MYSDLVFALQERDIGQSVKQNRSRNEQPSRNGAHGSARVKKAQPNFMFIILEVNIVAFNTMDKVTFCLVLEIVVQLSHNTVGR